ncbi:uncharacterized protein A1O5_13294, partial [Cladophialophora psammophila CBS 110553]
MASGNRSEAQELYPGNAQQQHSMASGYPGYAQLPQILASDDPGQAQQLYPGYTQPPHPMAPEFHAQNSYPGYTQPSHPMAPGYPGQAQWKSSIPGSRKRPAEESLPAGSQGYHSSKRQCQQGIFPGGFQHPSRVDRRLQKLCWKAFRTMDTKIKYLDDAYKDKREQDKWELLKSEREFEKCLPSLRGEYQGALVSVTQEHQKEGAHLRLQLLVNQRRLRDVRRLEDWLWRRSYAELDKIWDGWVSGNVQDVRPHLAQFVRHMDATANHLTST